jgi:DNA-binding NarL/FixJ family response regulator
MVEAGIPAGLSGVLLAAERGRDARALPLRDLVSLASDLSSDTGLTINFGAARQLGYPLVVLRLPNVRPSDRFDALTPREREVAAYVASGLPNRQIAARLWLTTATVKDHVHRILVKTGLPNRTAVAAAWNGEQTFNRSEVSATSV